MKRIIYILIPVFIASLLFMLYNMENRPTTEITTPSETLFYVGTYTNGNSKGIYQYALSADGKLDSVRLSATTNNPSYLAISADKKYILAVNEVEDGRVSSFLINENKLEQISESPSGGAHPCFITVNEAGQVLIANYTGGNIGLLSLKENGELSELLDTQQHYGRSITNRQESPHAHSVWFEPDGKHIISVDLGTDELLFSYIDSEKQKFVPSEQHKLKIGEGAGPRHLVFHPNQKWIYVVNELNATVSLVEREGNQYVVKGTYQTLPRDFNGQNTSADIRISNDGRFLYVSNRGHDSIAILAIGKEGKLNFIAHESTKGKGPRNFALSPDNNFLLVANQYTNNIVSFKRDTATGKLTYIDELKAPTPVCILF